VKSSRSYTDVLVALNYKGMRGSLCKMLKRRLERSNICIGHFSIVRSFPRKSTTFYEYTSRSIDRRLDGAKLKKKLLNENLIEEKCALCGLLPVWNGRPLCLQLDHIDGDATNNHISNLRLLCPSCHSQTETFGTKNPSIPPQRCMDCDTIIAKTSVQCQACISKSNSRAPPFESTLKRRKVE